MTSTVALHVNVTRFQSMWNYYLYAVVERGSTGSCESVRG